MAFEKESNHPLCDYCMEDAMEWSNKENGGGNFTYCRQCSAQERDLPRPNFFGKEEKG